MKFIVATLVLLVSGVVNANVVFTNTTSQKALLFCNAQTNLVQVFPANATTTVSNHLFVVEVREATHTQPCHPIVVLSNTLPPPASAFHFTNDGYSTLTAHTNDTVVVSGVPALMGNSKSQHYVMDITQKEGDTHLRLIEFNRSLEK